MTTFPVSAFADPWEYGNDDDEDDIDSLLEGTAAAEKAGGRGSTLSGRKKDAATTPAAGVVLLERRGNVTEVGMELRVGTGSGKEGGALVRGDLEVSF